MYMVQHKSYARRAAIHVRRQLRVQHRLTERHTIEVSPQVEEVWTCCNNHTLVPLYKLVVRTRQNTAGSHSRVQYMAFLYRQ